MTYGQNHIKFWRLGSDPRAGSGALNPTSESGVYALGSTHTVTGACFLPSGNVLTGGSRAEGGGRRGRGGEEDEGGETDCKGVETREGK